MMPPTSIDQAGTYKAREEIWFDDGREEELLAFVELRSKENHKPTATQILQLIDEFGASKKYMMNVGAEKGNIVVAQIIERKPQIMIELGGYVGYSTLLFADAVKQSGGARYISFEREPKFARIAQAFVDLAGLNDIVKIVVGSSSQNLIGEVKNGDLQTVDMMFLDHYKPAYVQDLKIAESLGLIKVGTVLVADNVISPGNPPYLEYVRGTPEQRRRRNTQTEEFPDRTRNQYSKQHDLDTEKLPGIPDIMYQSRLIVSREPDGGRDGVEISKCVSLGSA